jgi:hypothetical protein
MRKICDSWNEELMPEYRLRALASSKPNGFSITSRGQSPAALTFSDDRPRLDGDRAEQARRGGQVEDVMAGRAERGVALGEHRAKPTVGIGIVVAAADIPEADLRVNTASKDLVNWSAVPDQEHN